MKTIITFKSLFEIGEHIDKLVGDFQEITGDCVDTITNVVIKDIQLIWDKLYKASQIAKKYNCELNYIAEEPGMDIYWTNNCYYPTYKLEGNMISQIIYFESEGEVLDYLICNFSFNKSITRKIKNLEKYLWDQQSESKYEHEPNIEKIIEEIQKSHKEDDFYLQIHKFDYVEPEDTEA